MKKFTISEMDNILFSYNSLCTNMSAYTIDQLNQLFDYEMSNKKRVYMGKRILRRLRRLETDRLLEDFDRKFGG